MSQEDPQRTVQTFIDLVQRHEQSFYSFVHNVHSKGQGLFDSLMAWVELFLSYARDGLSQPVDLEFILPHGGPERQAIMAEVDSVAQYHYRLKVAHEEKVRRRFNKEGGVGTTADEAALLESVMASLSIGETAMGEAGEIADEESEEEDEYDDMDDYSEASSIRSVPIQPSRPPPPPPPHSDELAPPETEISRGRPRRGSNNSAHPSLQKIRSTLEFKRHSSDHTPKDENKTVNMGKDDKRPPPTRVAKPSRSRKKSRKAREKAAQELLKAPETPAIDELRPLFVEVVSAFLCGR